METKFGSNITNFNAFKRSVGLVISNLNNESVHTVVLPF